mmetsp:Transcript_10497/g.9056  ORF Transcript_10497/g.9056 Transcript_10497/m.9056 type:complete len:213 (-) Transcript_10497:1174-1812(-)
MDTDKSGQVSIKEFKAKSNELYLPPHFTDNFEIRFTKFNKKGKGMIDLDVYAAIYSEEWSNHNMSSLNEDIKQLYDKIDFKPSEDLYPKSANVSMTESFIEEHNTELVQTDAENENNICTAHFNTDLQDNKYTNQHQLNQEDHLKHHDENEDEGIYFQTELKAHNPSIVSNNTNNIEYQLKENELILNQTDMNNNIDNEINPEEMEEDNEFI